MNRYLTHAAGGAFGILFPLILAMLLLVGPNWTDITTISVLLPIGALAGIGIRKMYLRREHLTTEVTMQDDFICWPTFSGGNTRTRLSHR